MKAISIKQPWAWLVAHGFKDIENRNWRYAPKFRGRLLIHAGKVVDSVPLSVMDFIKRQIGFLPGSEVFEFGGIVGEAELVDCVRGHHPSPWFSGPLGLVIANATPLSFCPFPGQLGLFEVPDDYVRAP